MTETGGEAAGVSTGRKPSRELLLLYHLCFLDMCCCAAPHTYSAINNAYFKMPISAHSMPMCSGLLSTQCG